MNAQTLLRVLTERQPPEHECGHFLKLSADGSLLVVLSMAAWPSFKLDPPDFDRDESAIVDDVLALAAKHADVIEASERRATTSASTATDGRGER